MTKSIKFTAIFHILIGLSIVLMWGMFYFTDQIPELETAPLEIATHLVAELLTAALLILSGILLLKKHPKANLIYACAFGSLLYSVINSSGYFLSPFDIAMTIMFSFILISTSALFVLHIIATKKIRQL